MDIPIPDSDDPLDLVIDVRELPVTGRDGFGEKTPTVRELIEILSALPERFQDLPVARYCDDGIAGIDCESGYDREDRRDGPTCTMHVKLW